MATMQGKRQNTLYLVAGEVTTVEFDALTPLEFYNYSGGTVWMKWHGDLIPSVGGDDSTPIPVQMSYQRTVQKVGIVADSASTFVINVM